MRRCFHLPTKVTWPAEAPGLDRPALEQAILGALARAVENAAGGAAEIVVQGGPPVAEAVRAPADPSRWDATGGYRVPSYDDDGKPTTLTVKAGGRRAGPREAIVRVRWSEDDQDFYERVARALGRSAGFRGIRADEITTIAGSGSDQQGLGPTAKAFHLRYAMKHSDRKEGQWLTLRVTAAYDPAPARYTPPLKDIRISLAEAAAAPAAPPPTVVATPAPPIAPVRRADETAEQRLERHLSDVTGMLARMLVRAAAQGGNGARFAVEFDGSGLSPLRGDLQGPDVQPGHDCRLKAGTAPFSEEQAKSAVRSALDDLVRSGKPGVLDAYYCFAGGLKVQKWTIDPPAPPPPPSRPGMSPDEQLAEQIARYRAWYAFAQTTIIEGLAEHDPTKPKNLVWTAASIAVPIGVVKVAKGMRIIESTEGLVSSTRRAERAADAAKDIRQADRAADLARDIRKARIIQRSEALRLQRKYASRVRTEYPAETWDYIEQLETNHPGLAAAELRPLARPAVADPWVFNERMQTSQGRFSFQGKLGRENIQLDDITPDGWVIEVKYRDRLHWGDMAKFETQLRRHSEFARENSLPGVRWEVNDELTRDALWDLIKNGRIRNIVPVLVP